MNEKEKLKHTSQLLQIVLTVDYEMGDKYMSDVSLIRKFTDADISVDTLPHHLLGGNWYNTLRNKMNIWGWTRHQPSMQDILMEFRKVEYEQRKYYLQYQYRTVKAFVKETTVYGWSNSGKVALTMYRIKLHSENGTEYICWA